MAEMNNKQRALHYYERLLRATNKNLESKIIAEEINQLYWTRNNNPLTKEEKIALIRDIEKLIKEGGKPARENYIEKRGGLENLDEYFSVNASDNSDLIDLIAAMRGSVK
ncbi:hypothetical protein GSA70_003451 [Salmonella enterica]|nr:hypothetical protein [Salmonella enterica subsp. enterica serovar Newport]EBR2821630.1 hypothetical protein [Salmonella enterica]EDZ6270335.1 hypothetical protein [Salmonella enterica]EJK0477401.1 hypothetical protein [Salmonella enterica]EKM7994206.1 hypothetical protein [Salmonella enterica]